MKKIIAFLKDLFWIFKGKKVNAKQNLRIKKDELEEEILMLNKKYLKKYNGSKRYVKCPKMEKNV